MKTFMHFFCVQCALEHCYILIFVSFDYLLQPLNEVFDYHCLLLFITCQMVLRFLSFEQWL